MASINDKVGDIRVETADGSFIPGSRRENGTWRKARKVKKGYIPQEEQPIYKVKERTFSAEGSGMKAPRGITPRDIQSSRQFMRFEDRKWMPRGGSKIHGECSRSSNWSPGLGANNPSVTPIVETTDCTGIENMSSLDKEVPKLRNDRLVAFTDRSNVHAEISPSFLQNNLTADRFSKIRDRNVQLVNVASYHNRRHVTFEDSCVVGLENGTKFNRGRNRNLHVADVSKCPNSRRVTFADSANEDERNKSFVPQRTRRSVGFGSDHHRNVQTVEAQRWQTTNDTTNEYNSGESQGYAQITNDINRKPQREARNSHLWSRVSFPHRPCTDFHSTPNTLQNEKASSPQKPLYTAIIKPVVKVAPNNMIEKEIEDIQIKLKQMDLAEDDMERKWPMSSKNTVRRAFSGQCGPRSNRG